MIIAHTKNKDFVYEKRYKGSLNKSGVQDNLQYSN